MAEKDDDQRTVVFFHPDLGIGGAERLVVDAAVGLQNRGHKVVIFTSHCDKSHCFEEARDGTSAASFASFAPGLAFEKSIYNLTYLSTRNPRRPRPRQLDRPSLHPRPPHDPLRHPAPAPPPRPDLRHPRTPVPKPRHLLRRPAQRGPTAAAVPRPQGAHPLLLPLPRYVPRPRPRKVVEASLSRTL